MSYEVDHVKTSDEVHPPLPHVQTGAHVSSMEQYQALYKEVRCPCAFVHGRVCMCVYVCVCARACTSERPLMRAHVPHVCVGVRASCGRGCKLLLVSLLSVIVHQQEQVYVHACDPWRIMLHVPFAHRAHSLRGGCDRASSTLTPSGPPKLWSCCSGTRPSPVCRAGHSARGTSTGEDPLCCVCVFVCAVVVGILTVGFVGVSCC